MVHPIIYIMLTNEIPKSLQQNKYGRGGSNRKLSSGLAFRASCIYIIPTVDISK